MQVETWCTATCNAHFNLSSWPHFISRGAFMFKQRVRWHFASRESSRQWQWKMPLKLAVKGWGRVASKRAEPKEFHYCLHFWTPQFVLAHCPRRGQPLKWQQARAIFSNEISCRTPYLPILYPLHKTENDKQTLKSNNQEMTWNKATQAPFNFWKTEVGIEVLARSLWESTGCFSR